MKNESGSTVRAFTLIEILTVMAIILILIAIALPALKSAVTKANVAQAMAELQTLVVVIESYRIDFKSYPLAADEQGAPIDPYPPIGFGPEVFETRTPTALTTPVAYIGELPRDPFASNEPDDEDPRHFEAPLYHYGSSDYAMLNDGPPGTAKFQQFVRMLDGPPESVRYFVASHGPDYDHDDDEMITEYDAAALYNPTNGTISSGDIVYLGPGHGFGR